jgi:hypothetical protein
VNTGETARPGRSFHRICATNQPRDIKGRHLRHTTAALLTTGTELHRMQAGAGVSVTAIVVGNRTLTRRAGGRA